MRKREEDRCSIPDGLEKPFRQNRELQAQLRFIMVQSLTGWKSRLDPTDIMRSYKQTAWFNP